MGLVKINDKYFVDVDEKVLTLQRNPQIGKNGRTRFDIVGYFHNWDLIFDKLVNIFIADEIEAAKIVTLTELKQIFIVTRIEVRELLRDYTKTEYGQGAQTGRTAS